MIRRSVTRVLLSLLLLLSQQMAIAHAVTHWSSRVAAPAANSQREGGRSVSDAFAQDQGCSKCLAFAQFASALGSEPCRFVPPAADSQPVSGWNSHTRHARTVCVFDSRAPPVSW